MADVHTDSTGPAAPRGRSAAATGADLVIFDCDGVLVDSEVLVVDIEAEMLTALGAPFSPAEVAQHFTGLSDAHMAEVLQRDWGVNLPANFDEERTRRIQQRFNESLTAIAGISQVLEELRERNMGRCVASSSSPARIARSLELTGLLDHFDGHLYSAAMVQHGKPAPDLFLHAASELGVAPEQCVVIEDSPHGVKAGRAAGMHVIGFTAGAHCPPNHADRLRTAGAHDVLATSTELAATLRQLHRRTDAVEGTTLT